MSDAAIFNPEAFSARIRQAMTARKLSYRQAAPEIGVSVATLNRVARGNAPDVESYLRIERWLDAAEREWLRQLWADHDRAMDFAMDEADRADAAFSAGDRQAGQALVESYKAARVAALALRPQMEA